MSPLPKFYFKVSITNVGDMSCLEVSGIEPEGEEITYRAGHSPVLTKQKMPGLKKIGQLTLTKCVFQENEAIWDWINSVNLNVIHRKTVTISLMDEINIPIKTWEVANAWPTTAFKEEENTSVLEKLVLAHEGVTVK